MCSTPWSASALITISAPVICSGIAPTPLGLGPFRPIKKGPDGTPDSRTTLRGSLQGCPGGAHRYDKLRCEHSRYIAPAPRGGQASRLVKCKVRERFTLRSL